MGGKQYSWGKKRQSQEVDSGQHDVVIPWITLGGIIPLPGVHLDNVSSRIRDAEGTTE